MNDKKIFSKFYSTEATRNEDKPKFRNRVLKYLEDHVREGFPVIINQRCRSEIGIDIKVVKGDRHAHDKKYYIEDTFGNLDISEILDFITIVYDTEQEYLPDSILQKDRLDKFVKNINRIFQEESMCYVLNENGRVRYFPDEEFHQLVKSTLVVLNKPKYLDNLKTFNEVLDDLYKNHNKESPIHEFFKCVETFVLSLTNDKKFNRLNDSSIDTLMDTVDEKIKLDASYMEHDKDASSNIRNIFKKWVTMCHKYRHGKADQINNNVPVELFNYIFSEGVSIFRYLLEIDDKYKVTP